MENIKLKEFLEKFNYTRPTKVDLLSINGEIFPKFINEFWASKQRQGNSLHEIAYRACFKSELPNFFIKILTKSEDIVYDPFSGRGTTPIEGSILGRNIISNDINPISRILSEPRLSPPYLSKLEERLYSIPFNNRYKSDIDLSAFYHPKTELEIISIKRYLEQKKEEEKEDDLDKWIRMIATNRLTGHSSGYFSVYTLPPNQAVSHERQKKINIKRNQKPEYRDTRSIIIKKTKALTKDLNEKIKKNLEKAKKRAIFLEQDSRLTKKIKSNSVSLTITSPPFLDTVQYADDNWLRCWFNSIDAKRVGEKITMAKKIEDWREVMGGTLRELYRITKKDGYVAFEVGEVRSGKIKLDEEIIPLSISAGFNCIGVMVNEQLFTKTSNIWGISNNQKGTNSNRIVILNK